MKFPFLFLAIDTSLTPLVIHKFMITPDEIVKGKSVNLTAAGTLSKFKMLSFSLLILDCHENQPN